MSGQSRFEPRPQSEIDVWTTAQKIPPQFRGAGFPKNLVGFGLNNERIFDLYSTVGRHLNTQLEISARVRELLIIRCSVTAGSTYEWGHHVRIGTQAGLSAADLASLNSATAAGLSESDAVLVRGCDELIHEAHLSEETFQALSADFTTSELIEIVSVVGFYYWTAMMLRSFQVPVETALPGSGEQRTELRAALSRARR